jgi:hypothetical protein
MERASQQQHAKWGDIVDDELGSAPSGSANRTLSGVIQEVRDDIKQSIHSRSLVVICLMAVPGPQQRSAVAAAAAGDSCTSDKISACQPVLQQIHSYLYVICF